MVCTKIFQRSKVYTHNVGEWLVFAGITLPEKACEARQTARPLFCRAKPKLYFTSEHMLSSEFRTA